jgi:hypothetical protein
MPLDQVIQIRAFDLDQKLQLDAHFLEGEMAFEWCGAYELAAGEYTLTFDAGPDPVMGLAMLHLETGDHDHDHDHDHADSHAQEHKHTDDHDHDPHDHDHNHGDCSGGVHEALHEAEEVAEGLFEGSQSTTIRQGAVIKPGKVFYKAVFGADATQIRVHIAEAGHYALFTQHGPDEFAMRFQSAQGETLTAGHVHEHGHKHEHDATVLSVGLEESKELDSKKLNAWLSELLQTKGQDIFRMKGVLNIKGSSNRFVFQGVHMLFEGKADRPWKPDEKRKSQMIFIGRNLDRAALNAGFRRCIA